MAALRGAISCAINLRPTRHDKDLRAIWTIQDSDASDLLTVGLEAGELMLLLRRAGRESRFATAA